MLLLLIVRISHETDPDLRFDSTSYDVDSIIYT